jgi:hypothetical protein
MSSTLSVYVISFDRLKKVRGSRDRGLVEAIGAELESFLSQVDELRDEDEDVPTCRDAVAQIIEGAPLAAHLGYLYGYALEAICAHLGRELPGVSSISRAAAWIDVVDELLEGKGIPIGLSTLVFGVCPVDIPTPDDHPSIGSWPPHVIPGALEAIRRADLAGSDDETTETIAQVRGWLEAAAGDPEEGLMGFLS